MPVEVREAQLEDTSILTRLCLELGYDGDEAVVRRRLDRTLSRSDHAVYVAVERPHGVIAMIHASVSISVLERPVVDIGAFIVTTAARRGGAGRMLIERIHAWALKRGVDDITARFQPHRNAGGFFAKLGYTINRHHEVFRRDLASPIKQGAARTDMD